MIAVRIEGREDRPSIVFAHALGTDHTLWDRQVAHFALDYRIVQFDARGHGASDVPPGSAWPLDALANDLLEVIDRADAAPAHFVGISMGALTGLAAAALAPARFASLTLCDAHLFTTPAFTTDLLARAAEVDEGGLPALAARMVARWFPPQAHGDPQVIARLQAIVAQTAPAAYAACVRGLASYDLRPLLQRLSMPVLLACGEHDGDTPAKFRALAGLNERARFVMIPAAGHLPNVQAPGEFNAALEAFLACA